MNKLQVYVSAVLFILLSSCTVPIFTTPTPTVEPNGRLAETVVSPSGRFSAQLWRCCDVYNYISAFEIHDTNTQQRYRQVLSRVERLHHLAGGISFEWTPTENYLVIVTDNMVTSSECDELLVYSGDGSVLVYSSAMTSVCNVHPTATMGMDIIALCPNDDIVFTSGVTTFRLTPSTSIVTQTRDVTCQAS